MNNRLILSQISVMELGEILKEKLNEALREAQSSKDNKKLTKEHLTRQEVAKMCGVKSMSTLWDWNRKGLLKHYYKAGRKPLYKYEDVIEFLTKKAA
jgi:hypothetical protein